MLVTDEGETVLRPGMVAGFRAGTGQRPSPRQSLGQDRACARSRHAHRRRGRVLFRHRHDGARECRRLGLLHQGRTAPEMSFSKILVANRGEIAWRVMRTAKAMGYRTVAVYSDADADAPHVALRRRGGAHRPARRSARAISASTASSRPRTSRGADAVHPGYGFLSENEAFARRLREGRPGLHRPAAGRHRRHGQQGRRQAAHDRCRRAVRAGLSGRRPERRQPREGGAQDRLAGDGQGGGRRRRPRHAPGRARRPTCWKRSARRAPRPRAPSARAS